MLISRCLQNSRLVGAAQYLNTPCRILAPAYTRTVADRTDANRNACLLGARSHACFSRHCTPVKGVARLIQACHTPVKCCQRCFSTWTPTPDRRTGNWDTTRPQSLLHYCQLLCILVEVLRLVLKGMMHLQLRCRDSRHTSVGAAWNSMIGCMPASVQRAGRTCVSTRTSSSRSVLGYTSSRISAFRCHSSRALCIAACLLRIKRFCSLRNSAACFFIACSFCSSRVSGASGKGALDVVLMCFFVCLQP